MRPFPEIAADLRRIADELTATPVVTPPSTAFTVVRPGESIQAALDNAVPGHTLHLVRGGIYPGNLTIRKPVTLLTAGMDDLGAQRVTHTTAAGLAQLVPVNGSPLIDIVPGVVDVGLSRLACDPANLNDVINIGHADSSQRTVDQQPSQIVLTQLYMQGGPTSTAKRGIGLHARNVVIEHSHIAGIKRGGQDTQAIGGWNGEGTYDILDCYLEAAGETVMFGGADPTIPGVIPSDIILQGCTLTKDLAWRAQHYTVKNLLELKAARRVTVTRCEFSNCWSAGQGGYAFMFTVQSQDGRNPNVIVEDVTVEHCTVRNVGAGINLLGMAQINPSLQSRNFVIRHNWFQIEQSMGVQAWFLLLSRGPREVAIVGNTIETSSTNAVVHHEGPPVVDFAFTNNLVPRCGAYGFSGNVNGSIQHRGVGLATYLPGADITGNAFGSFPGANNMPSNFHAPTASVTVTDGYGVGPYAIYGRQR